MKLYRTTNGLFLIDGSSAWRFDEDWDTLINRENLENYLASLKGSSEKVNSSGIDDMLAGGSILPPIVKQEVWAAGVTYLKSRDARMEESQSSGGASLYDKVYDADRPELFFKATASRVSGHRQQVYIRKDSSWNVPEPELTLFINSNGDVQGYTIGNDMSSRSIEGENALYLPQAKIYEKSAALGPCLYISSLEINGETAIRMVIKRDDKVMYNDVTAVSQLKRKFKELAGYLYRECDFPHGCFLMTGTCLVPPPDFTLQEDDVVEITIDIIGTLVNTVGLNAKHKAN